MKKFEKLENAVKAYWWGIPFAVILLLFLSFFSGFTPGMPKGLGEKGQFGDSFGVLNSLFTGLGFAGLVVTLIMQQRQIRKQSEEFQEQLNDAAIRRYEENLFQIFSLYQDALKSVVSTKDGKTLNARDALSAATESLLKCIRQEKVNTIPHEVQARYQAGKSTEEDRIILDFLYYRNFWHLNYSFPRQGRLIETLKTLLRHLEDKAPKNADIDVYRKIILSQITYIEVSYFFFVALGFRDEEELRDLLLRSGLIKKASNIYKLQVHRFMYLEFWKHDLRRDKLERPLPIGNTRIKAVTKREKKIRARLEELKMPPAKSNATIVQHPISLENGEND